MIVSRACLALIDFPLVVLLSSKESNVSFSFFHLPAVARRSDELAGVAIEALIWLPLSGEYDDPPNQCWSSSLAL